MAADHPNNAPGVPMLMPVWLERFQIRFLNPIVKPFARFVPGFATVSHTGRTSGKKYETVVNASRTGDLLAIGLMHGKTNWVKNVLAAGEADIRLVRGGDVHVTNPRVIPVGTDDAALPPRVRRMTRRVGVFLADIST
jgi:deazaflavin-dependent oxidoreductase (nitroreductase family)